MRKVLLISPHFPPDSTAGAHRVRLLAPYLSTYGWDPTVLTCREGDYEGLVDSALAGFVPSSLRVVRATALPASITRIVRVGDLGVRSFVGLLRAASRLLERDRFDALFITIFPGYTALLGPLLRRRFHVPFVLDYQDPWVGAWGADVGGGPGGRVDLKSRVSRGLAAWLEPHAVRSASAITAVSAGTYEPILLRNPGIQPITEAIPLGAEPLDFSHAVPPDAILPFDPSDGRVHVCYTGTILPLGVETLTAVLRAVGLVRDRRPDLFARLRLHFIGTSNQQVPTTTLRVAPLARSFGIADVINELPTRLPYSTIVHVQRRASVLLALGSSEPHYTASKIFPLLLAKRPLLAVYHDRSTVTDMLSRITRPPSVSLVGYSETERAEAKTEIIYEKLVSLVERPVWNDADVNLSELREYFAETLAGRLARVFDRVATRAA